MLFDHGYLEDDVDFNVEIDAVVTEVSVVGVSNESFKCKQCEKVCKSKRGLTRHIKVKHVVVVDNTSGSSGFNWMSEKDVTWKKQHIAKLNFILKTSADIASKYMCLPSLTRTFFQNFAMSPEELQNLWEEMRPLIHAYSSDAEKFYAEFYALLSKDMLPTKFDDITVTNILMTEVANHILMHLSDKNSDISSSSKPITSITDKEIKCLQYYKWLHCTQTSQQIQI